MPGTDAVDRQTEQKDGRDEDHAFAGPDDERLQEEKERADDAEAAGGVEGESEPVLELVQVWDLTGGA